MKTKFARNQCYWFIDKLSCLLELGFGIKNMWKLRFSRFQPQCLKIPPNRAQSTGFLFYLLRAYVFFFWYSKRALSCKTDIGKRSGHIWIRNPSSDTSLRRPYEGLVSSAGKSIMNTQYGSIGGCAAHVRFSKSRARKRFEPRPDIHVHPCYFQKLWRRMKKPLNKCGHEPAAKELECPMIVQWWSLFHAFNIRNKGGENGPNYRNTEGNANWRDHDDVINSVACINCSLIMFGIEVVGSPVWFRMYCLISDG